MIFHWICQPFANVFSCTCHPLSMFVSLKENTCVTVTPFSYIILIQLKPVPNLMMITQHSKLRFYTPHSGFLIQIHVAEYRVFSVECLVNVIRLGPVIEFSHIMHIARQIHVTTFNVKVTRLRNDLTLAEALYQYVSVVVVLMLIDLWFGWDEANYNATV